MWRAFATLLFLLFFAVFGSAQTGACCAPLVQRPRDLTSALSACTTLFTFTSFDASNSTTGSLASGSSVCYTLQLSNLAGDTVCTQATR